MITIPSGASSNVSPTPFTSNPPLASAMMARLLFVSMIVPIRLQSSLGPVLGRSTAGGFGLVGDAGGGSDHRVGHVTVVWSAPRGW